MITITIAIHMFLGVYFISTACFKSFYEHSNEPWFFITVNFFGQLGNCQLVEENPIP
jgi:hypothetical protein